MKPAKRIAASLVVCTVVIAASLSVTLGVGAAPPSQRGTPIVYGETVTGWLDEQTACLYYSFAGAAGDAVAIEMTRTSGDLDGTLALYQGDAISTPIAENDDRPGSGGLDPYIETTLPAAGNYTIAACRLQATQMRVTSGDFALTLHGPETASGPTPTPASALSNSLFGDPSPTPGNTPTIAAPGDFPITLTDSNVITGSLAEDQDSVRYEFEVESGDQVELVLMRTDGNLNPLIQVTSSTGMTIAEAGSADPTFELRLIFIAPVDDVLQIAITRYGTVNYATSGTYLLSSSKQPALFTGLAPDGAAEPDAPTAETPTPSDDSADSSGDYLANACQSGDQAISGLGSSDLLVDVYLAAGDSYYVEELTRTDVFSTDDDLNAVFLVQNVTAPVMVAGVFCAPDGSTYDAGASEFDPGGPSLVGLDWEYLGEAWLPGEWYVELYVDGALELTMRFTVAG